MARFIIPARSDRRARDVPGTDTLQGSLRLFFSSPTPRIFSLSILAYTAARLSLGLPFQLTELWIALGVIAGWPLLEWVLHMYLLHMRPLQLGPWTLDLYAGKIHRYHHRHPDNIERIFLPTEAMLVMTPIHLGVWWLCTPQWSYALTGAAVFTATTLCYEWVHFIVHMPYLPKSRWLSTVRKNHHLHHFKHEDYWHAFTVPWVDTLMGTNPDPNSIGRSPTVKTLGVEEDLGPSPT